MTCSEEVRHTSRNRMCTEIGRESGVSDDTMVRVHVSMFCTIYYQADCTRKRPHIRVYMRKLK